MLTPISSYVRCAIGALFALSLSATTAVAQNSILETFNTGTITTGNGTTVVWADGTIDDPTGGWSAGPRPIVPGGPNLIIPPVGNKTWQSGPRAIGGNGESILLLTVQIGPQGGTLSFDWATDLSESLTELFLVESQHQRFLFARSDVPPWDGHEDGVLLPGTNIIRFMVSGTINGPGQAAIDNIRVTGIVPEPASLAFVSIAATCLIRRRRS